MQREQAEPVAAPTPERVRHGPVERAERPVKQTPGDYDYDPPFVAIDLLEGMLRRGAITKEEKRAGELFRSWFNLSQLEGLRAADMGRPYIDAGAKAPEASIMAERARNEINRAIRWVGGLSSTPALCLYHVIGLDESLRAWSSHRSRTMSHHHASGVLLVALERLARMPWRGPGEKNS